MGSWYAGGKTGGGSVKIKLAKKEDQTGFKPLLIVMNHTTVTISPVVIASLPAVILIGYLLAFGGGV